MGWMPTTVQDGLAQARNLLRDEYQNRSHKQLTKFQLRALRRIRNFLRDDENNTNPLLPCGCNRLVPADCLTVIPASLRDRVGNRLWACGSCIEKAVRRGIWTREEFATEAGAPTSVINKARERDVREA